MHSFPAKRLASRDSVMNKSASSLATLGKALYGMRYLWVVHHSFIIHCFLVEVPC